MTEGSKITLVASALAQKVHRRLKRKKQLGKGLALPPAPPTLAKSVKFRPAPKKQRRVMLSDGEEIGLSPTGTLERGIVDAFEAATRFLLERTEVARHRRASLAVTAQPLMGKKPKDPTELRDARANYGITEEAITEGIRAYRVRTAIQEFRRHMTEDELATNRRFVDDFEAACHVDVISKIYTGMQGGGAEGLTSHISEIQRIAHARFNFLVRPLDARFRSIAETLLLEVQIERLGRPMTVAEVAAAASVYRKLENQNACGVGLMKGTIWRIAEAYKAWDAHYERVGHNARVQELNINNGAKHAVRHVENSAPRAAPPTQRLHRAAVAD